jgi:hypothetical protein
VSGIVALLDRGATRLKKPRILFAVGDLNMRLSIASERARFPGSIDVTTSSGSEWFGRIHRDGRFEPSGRADTDVTPAIVAALQAFAANPEKVAREYGRRMGACCACGKALVDPVSVYLGYGPICAERYSWPHRVDGLTTKQVDEAAESEAAISQSSEHTYAELQAMRSQGHDEARRLGRTSIDIEAVEREIAKLDAPIAA